MFRRVFALALVTATAVAADPAYDAAVALVREHRYPEARDALEHVVAASPANAGAWHELGLVWRARRDASALESAARCLGQAVTLEPRQAAWLVDYGIVALELASRTRSLAVAGKGRAALEQALQLDPANLDAREALFQFHTQAPFFAGGSSAKAAAQLEEIRRRDPDRALAIAVGAKTAAKDYRAAFALCDGVLHAQPDNYTALYQYGRTASLSGQQLPRGLECLQHMLQLPPPGPRSPSPANVWYRIGTIQQQLGRVDDAKKAFDSAVALDPRQTAAAAARQKLP